MVAKAPFSWFVSEFQGERRVYKMMQAFGNSYLHAKPIICKPVKRTPHTDQPAVLQYCRHLYSYCLCQTSLCIQAPSHASCMEDKTFYLSSDMVCRTINTVWLCNQVGEPVGPPNQEGGGGLFCLRTGIYYPRFFIYTHMLGNRSCHRGVGLLTHK